MVNQESSSILEGGGQALLLLHGAGDTAARRQETARALHEAGLTVCVPRWLQPGESWISWLGETRASFSALRQRHVCVSVGALGAGIWPALLLAEEYTPERLFLLPEETTALPLRDALSLRRMARRARVDLFAVSARTHLFTREDASPAAVRQARRLGKLLHAATLEAVPAPALPTAIARHLGLREEAERAPEPTL